MVNGFLFDTSRTENQYQAGRGRKFNIELYDFRSGSQSLIETDHDRDLDFLISIPRGEYVYVIILIEINTIMSDFDQRIAALDTGLFEKITSQSTDTDKQTLLACQLAVRELKSSFSYLEIGSYLGGSIQPYILDVKCARVYSIDKRPETQPDARGYDWVYQNNSTQRMLELLKEVGPTDKVTTIDGDTIEIKPTQVDEKIDLCFIDGEHTDEAVLRDFRFCLDVLAENGAIMFHDSQITYNGIAASVKYLEDNARPFRAYSLPNFAFVIEIGDFPIHKNERVMERLVNNYQSFLPSLQYNDNYRRFSTRFPFGMIRRTLIKVRRSNVSQ